MEFIIKFIYYLWNNDINNIYKLVKNIYSQMGIAETIKALP